MRVLISILLLALTVAAQAQPFSLADRAFTSSDQRMSWAAYRLTTPSTGSLIADYWFTEGVGTVVKDRKGALDINLAAPTNPNFTWKNYGGNTLAGLIQTPTMTNARTVVVLCRVPVTETTGFVVSAGSASNLGLLIGAKTTGYVYWIGQQRGVRPVSFQRAGLNNFNGAYNQGHWYVAFVEEDAQHTSVVGLGGRHSTTTSRIANFDVAYAAIYTGALNDADRATIYACMRKLAVCRGFIIDSDDAPSTSKPDWVLHMGQSNADGRALITDLSTNYQAKTQPANVTMFRNSRTAIEQLQMGVNQTFLSPTLQFGPQMSLAWTAETNSRPLAITQYAIGGTVVGLNTNAGWNVAQTNNPYFYLMLTHVWRQSALALAAKIGRTPKAITWVHGESDALDATYAAAYYANMTNFISELRTQLILPTTPFIVTLTPDDYPSYNPTDILAVRTAQTNVVTALSYCALVNCDDIPLQGDALHYTMAGQLTLGNRLYNNIFP
jgi:hypothetical protein